MGRWVGGWVGWVEEKEAVRMSCWTLEMGGWVGRWVNHSSGGWVGGWVGGRLTPFSVTSLSQSLQR